MVMMGVTNFLAYIIPDIPSSVKEDKRREIKRFNDKLDEEEEDKKKQ